MVTIQGLSKTFLPGTVNEKRALKNISINIKDGEFVTVIGGNGAGKSTLMNCLAGVFPVTTGEIVLNGLNITKMKENKRAKFLGRVFQDPTMGTAGDMIIEENLAMAKRRGKVRSLRWGITAQEREYYQTYLQQLDLGLESRLTTKVGFLSGGQRQALTLLMATLQKPQLLLLDEHTAALDPKTAQKVLGLTEKIVEENQLTTLMITHNMKDAIRLGTRLIMMYNGEVIYDVEGEEKKRLTTEDLMRKFEEVSRGEFANDRMLLS